MGSIWVVEKMWTNSWTVALTSSMKSRLTLWRSLPRMWLRFLPCLREKIPDHFLWMGGIGGRWRSSKFFLTRQSLAVSAIHRRVRSQRSKRRSWRDCRMMRERFNFFVIDWVEGLREKSSGSVSAMCEGREDLIRGWNWIFREFDWIVNVRSEGGDMGFKTLNRFYECYGR